MQTTLWILLFIYTIYIVGLGIYYGWVNLNQFFTFSDLPVSSVPFYDPNAVWPTLSDRYSLNWFVYLSDMFLILPPMTGFAAVAFIVVSRGDKNWYIVNLMVVSALILLQFLKWGWFMAQYGFCGSLGQQCRPYNPSTPAQSFGNTNFVFLGSLIFSGLVIVWLVVILVFSATVDSAYEKWKNDELLKDDVTKQEVIRLVEHVHEFGVPESENEPQKTTSPPLNPDKSPIYKQRVNTMMEKKHVKKREEESTWTDAIKNNWNAGVEKINYYATGKPTPDNIVQRLMFANKQN